MKTITVTAMLVMALGVHVGLPEESEAGMFVFSDSDLYDDEEDYV